MKRIITRNTKRHRVTVKIVREDKKIPRSLRRPLRPGYSPPPVIGVFFWGFNRDFLNQSILHFLSSKTKLSMVNYKITHSCGILRLWKSLLLMSLGPRPGFYGHFHLIVYLLIIGSKCTALYREDANKRRLKKEEESTGSAWQWKPIYDQLLVFYRLF